MAEGSIQEAIQAQTADRRSQAVQMRVDGHSLETIALALEYKSIHDASTDINRALADSIAAQDHAVDVYREIELQRMDQWLLALRPGILKGIARSIEIAIKIAERRAKLLGLDSTTKLEITTIDNIDNQIALLTAQLAEQGVDFSEM